MDNVRPRDSYSPIKRSYYTKPAFRPKDLKQDVKTFGVQNMTTAGTRVVVNTAKGKMDTDLRKSRWVWRPKGKYLDHVSKDSGSFMLKKGNPEILLQDHAVVDSGCSSHMTGNKAYHSDYEDYNGGFVAFGSDPKGGKITGKGSSGKDKGPTQEYILLPLQPHRTRIPVEYVAPAAHEKPSESSPKDNDVQDSEDVADKEGQHQMTEDEQVLHDELEKMIAYEVRAAQTTSINKLSTGRSSISTTTTSYVSAASTPTGANAGESSFVYLGGTIPIDASTLPNIDLPIDPNMPDLENDSDAFSSDGIFNGTYDNENVGVVADFNNMDDTINVSPIPTLRIHKNHPKDQILRDPKSAVQTRGKIQKASSAQEALVSYISKQNRTNHKDHQNFQTTEARLVAQGFRQEEGIDYDEVFAPVARIETIRLFLAFASYMGFTVYQMDVKSAFLYGTIEEEVYVHQPPGFVDLAYPKKVYKKMVSGEDKYVANILKKFDFWSIRTATTPIASNKPLVKDEDGEDVDVHVYRSMIGSLMYLTASRPDIMFDVCLC
ncbi:ribonuclease H-like domain-containing protein [Tanacetum coccineum]